MKMIPISGLRKCTNWTLKAVDSCRIVYYSDTGIECVSSPTCVCGTTPFGPVGVALVDGLQNAGDLCHRFPRARPVWTPCDEVRHPDYRLGIPAWPASVPPIRNGQASGGRGRTSPPESGNSAKRWNRCSPKTIPLRTGVFPCGEATWVIAGSRLRLRFWLVKVGVRGRCSTSSTFGPGRTPGVGETRARCPCLREGADASKDP